MKTPANIPSSPHSFIHSFTLLRFPLLCPFPRLLMAKPPHPCSLVTARASLGLVPCFAFPLGWSCFLQLHIGSQHLLSPPSQHVLPPPPMSDYHSDRAALDARSTFSHYVFHAYPDAFFCGHLHHSPGQMQGYCHLLYSVLPQKDMFMEKEAP